MKSQPISLLAGALKKFLTEYLPHQRAASPHTILSYRDSLKLLLLFVAGKKGDTTSLTFEQITVEQVTAFLQHLEEKRKNRPSSRNVRLGALHSFFRYVGTQYPEHLALTQRLLSIPFKRTETREIQYLEYSEIQAVLNGIDRTTWAGRRDFALLTFMFNTGARVSEVVGLLAADLRLAEPPIVSLRGKGRKERTCPLWPDTARLLRRLLEEQGVAPERPETVFRNRWGDALTRFGVGVILRKRVQQAARQVPNLRHKRIHPHSLRHSTALHLLRAGVDLSTISHWLGHAGLNTTNQYVPHDLEAKREALAKAKPLINNRGHRCVWRKNENLIAWLESL